MEVTVLLVDSDANALKEMSMETNLTRCYKEGLAKIKADIDGKGAKKRDKDNRRLEKLNQRHTWIARLYDIDFEYNEKDVATSMSWRRKADSEPAAAKMHGKYFLLTYKSWLQKTN